MKRKKKEHSEEPLLLKGSQREEKRDPVWIFILGALFVGVNGVYTTY